MVAASPSETKSIADPTARISAIDGLRAWLAWIVVFSHCVQIVGLDRTDPHWWITQVLAREAVAVFIIISGFVICGLVTTQRERWDVFIVRRAFRIFPIYLVLLPVGAVTLYLAADVFAHMPWALNPSFMYDESVRGTIASVEAQPRAHILSHLFLAQGLIPNSAIPFIETSFLGPAWSLSLEWQFYLIAPLLIWLLRYPHAAAIAIGVCLTLALAYRAGAFGTYAFPSVLPAAILLFMAGIGARLMFSDFLRLVTAPAALALFALLCLAVFPSILPIAVWLAFLAMLAADNTTSFPDRALARARSVLFQSPLAQAQGARSYAVYLVHWPVVQAMAYLILPLREWGQYEALAAITVASFVVTALAAHILHIGVEKPMIRLGAKLANWMRRPRSTPAPALRAGAVP